MNDETLKVRIESILRTEAAAALSMDGIDLEVIDVIDGVARVRLGDACASCPASAMTLIMGLEQELRRHVPEVEYLEAVP